jgi:hypothetical protein
MRTAVALLAAFAFLAATACGGDDSTGETPTPAVPGTGTAAATATPTSPAATETASPEAGCPMVASACAQAGLIRAWIAAGDLDALVGAAEVRDYTCPAEPPNLGGPYPLCEGAPAGEVRAGMAVARRYSEGSTLSPEQYRDFLRGFVDAVDPEAGDAQGSGELRLVAVSCRPPGEDPAACSESIAIFSGILGAGREARERRELLLFFLDTSAGGDEVRVRETWTGIMLEGEPELIFETGANLFDLGEIFVLE